MKIEKYFDKIYCIHLIDRTDRLRSFIKNYTNIGTKQIAYFQAINGNKIVDPEWQYAKGALGCRLSHLEILKEAREKNYERILVFEDDAQVLKSFKDNLTHLISIVGNDWDMIYFGGYHFLKPDYIDDKIIKLNNTLTTHAIAINKRSLDKLINKIETDKRWIDSVIADLHPELKVYGFKHSTVIQRNGYSDVMNKQVRYSGSLLGKVYLNIYHSLKKIF